MRTIIHKKRQFAVGLSWNEFPEDAKRAQAIEFVTEALDEGVAGCWTILTGAPGASGEKTGRVIGFSDKEDIKGKVYSVAEALATHGVDGIYVGRLADDSYWYTVIQQGSVAPATDRIEPAEKCLHNVGVLRRVWTQLPVFCSEEEFIEDSVLFSLEAVLDSKAVTKKLKPLRQIKGDENQLLGGIVLGAVVLGIAGGAYWFFGVSHVDQDAANAEMARQSYIAGATAQLQGMPVSAVWAIESYEAVHAALPPVSGGFTLNKIYCEPSNCSGEYVLGDGAKGFSMHELRERFGASALTVSQDRSTLRVKVPVPSAKLRTDIDESFLRNPPAVGASKEDVIGQMGLAFAMVAVEQQPEVGPINASLGAPAEFPPLTNETLRVGYRGELELGSTKALLAFLNDSGFVPVSFNFVTGYGAEGASWSVNLTRLRGGVVY